MRIKTMRFGDIEISPEQVITFPAGLPGFSRQKKFVPVEYRKDSPLFFLQSIDLPELAFIIADPFQIITDYQVDIPREDQEALELNSPEDTSVYVILTLRQGGKLTTANLVAPLVINTRNRTGRQVVLFNSSYSSRYPLRINSRAQAK
jgi:flagellar assembly factor FliW